MEIPSHAAHMTMDGHHQAGLFTDRHLHVPSARKALLRTETGTKSGGSRCWRLEIAFVEFYVLHYFIVFAFRSFLSSLRLFSPAVDASHPFRGSSRTPRRTLTRHASADGGMKDDLFFFYILSYPFSFCSFFLFLLFFFWVVGFL
jgi:hypothetical protein